MNFPNADSSHFIKNSLLSYFDQVRRELQALDFNQMSEVVEALLEAHQRGSTIFICGNGGSAATASHFANDLAKGCMVEGQKRFRALALTDNVALITAWANDTHYENVFAEQLCNLVRPGDVLIAISGSGNSPNVLKAVEVAHASKALTVGFCGYGGGKLRQLVDLAISSDCTQMEQVEDLHMALCHNLATTLRAMLRQEQAVQEQAVLAAV